MEVRTAVIVAVVIALGLGVLLMRRGGDVSPAQARQLVHEGALLLDVRTPEEFASGHLPAAVNIPVQELERRIGELERTDRPIVLYCRSGNRSSRAAGILKSAGYAAVHDLGAMSRW
jgi:rhodanese-related sulfurtransferase